MARWKYRTFLVVAALGVGWGDRACAQDNPLPPGAIWRQGATRLRHPGGVSTLAFAPDGKSLASAGGDGAVRLWDPATGKELAFFYPSHDRRLYQLAFAPDGRTLAAGTGAGLFLYDVATRRVRRHSESEAVVVSFSADGRVLAGSGSTVSLWDLRSGKKLGQTPADNRVIYGLTVAPDGKSLAYAHTNPNNKPGETDLHLWDIAAGKEMRRLAGPKDWIHALRFSPDGKTIAAAAHSEVLIVDTATWARRFRLEKRVHDLAFCARTRRLAIATDQDVELYDTATGKLEQTLARQPPDVPRGRRLAVSADGATLATTTGFDGRIRLWDIATGKEKLPQPDLVNAVTGLAFSADGTTLASCFRDGRLQLFDARTGRPGKLLAERVPYVDAYNRNPSALVFARGGAVLAMADLRGHVRVWDTATGKEVRHWQAPDGSTQVDLTPDGKLLAAGSTSGVESLKLWGVGDGRPVRELPYAGPRGDKNWFPLGFGGPAFSPDGKRVAAVARPYERISGSIRLRGDRPPPPPASIQIWETASGKPAAGEGLRDDRLSSAAQVLFFPDGKTLATSGNPILLWDAAGRHVSRGFVHPPDSESGVMALSADGRWLAAACVLRGAAGTPQARRHVVCVWETASGKVAWRRANHRGAITALAFAPGAWALASGSADATVILWDLAPPARSGAPLPKRLSPKELAGLWDALAAPDAAAAYAAVHELESRPDQAVALLGDKLRPDPPVPVAQWLNDLQAREFARRDKARRALLGLGREALPPLLGLDEKQLNLEGQRRRQQLLRELPEHPYTFQQLRQIRAVAVLERIATPAARRTLEAIARGRPGSPQTEHAQAARARLVEDKRRAGYSPR